MPGLLNSSWPKSYQDSANARNLNDPSAHISLRWSYTTTNDPDEFIRHEPVIDASGNVYLLSNIIPTGHSFLTKLDNTGTVVWQSDITTEFGSFAGAPGQRGGMAQDSAGSIYVTMRNSVLASYSTVDGSLNWKYDVTVDVANVTIRVAPNVDPDGKIHVATVFGTQSGTIGQDNYAYAFNSDGTVLWKTKIWSAGDSDGGPSRGCGAISGNFVYYASYINHIQRLNRLTGTLDWTVDHGVSSGVGLNTNQQWGLTVANGLFYLSFPRATTNAEMLIVDISPSGSLNSTLQVEGGYIECLPTADSSGNIYFGTSGHNTLDVGGKSRILSYDASSAFRWAYQTTENGFNGIRPVAIANDALVALGEGDDSAQVGNLYRINLASGALIDKINYAPSGTDTDAGGDFNGVALTCDTLYVSVARTLYAYDTGGTCATPPTSTGKFSARSAGVVAHAVLTAAQNACLEVYFAGVDNGDDFTIMAYSAPTELCLLNPVAGHEYILEAPAADLARFLGKRMGNVKFQRAGAGGNYTGAILLRAIELYYKTRTT